MTARGKIVLTFIILAVVGFGVYRWWDKIAPAGRSQQVSINPQEMKKTLDASTKQNTKPGSEAKKPPSKIVKSIAKALGAIAKEHKAGTLTE